LISVLSVGLVVASGVVAAQPKKDAKKKKTPPAAGSATAPAGSGSGSGSAAGSAVTPIEEAPKDIEGREENPESPKGEGTEEPPPTTAPPPKPAGYPMEETQRPITLLKNMAEVGISPHAQVDPFRMSDSLRARYGITDKIQVGLTYVYMGVWDRMEIDAGQTSKTEFKAGKAVGLDFSYLVQDWIAAKVGFPLYIDPFAMSIVFGAPMKFHFGEKFVVGAMDDFLNIAVKTFPVSYYQEFDNAKAAFGETRGDTQSRGWLRFSGYAMYQLQPQVALRGDLALLLDDFSQTRNASGHGGWITSIRAGVNYALNKHLDLGGSLGFDDLSTAGSFAPQLFIAGRI
jgi:hypothetical protein